MAALTPGPSFTQMMHPDGCSYRTGVLNARALSRTQANVRLYGNRADTSDGLIPNFLVLAFSSDRVSGPITSTKSATPITFPPPLLIRAMRPRFLVLLPRISQ